MNGRLASSSRSALSVARRAAAFGRRRMVALGELWQRSLQFRVTTSTLALSSAVVFVLGVVLQNQIVDRLVETKERAALEQLRVAVRTAESQLVGDAGESDSLRKRLSSAIKAITNGSVGTQDTENSSAGAFEPVLVAGDPRRAVEEVIHAGPLEKVPGGLMNYAENNQVAVQYHTEDGSTYLIVGAPVTTATRPIQLYLLFPLNTEQNTVAMVQNTLLVGSAFLVVLLAVITFMVTRQVVLPVRRAAAAAEDFAEGDLDRRLDVDGEDDLAKLAVSYNEMAASIQRQIRQLEEFGQLQRRFTSDVSHELRTPLTTVRMAADVLYASRDEFPPGLSRSSELLVNELDRFETLLRDLLEISRLDAGVEELSAESTDVRSIVHSAVEQVRGVLEGNTGSDIVLELPDEEVTAEVDSRRVERILRNLLANAVDHGEGHPVRLILAADDHAVALSVRDYGVGLRPGEAELVFNRFWRADPSRNRRTGGTGLGLAISHEDARLHGGWLEAWGEPGCGSCFRLTLPRVAGDTLRHSPVPLPPDPPAESGGTAGENREATAVLSASQDRDGSEAVVNVVEQEETR